MLCNFLSQIEKIHDTSRQMAAFKDSMDSYLQHELQNFGEQMPHFLPKYSKCQQKQLFFGGTVTKIHCIKINHIWTQISYSTPY